MVLRHHDRRVDAPEAISRISQATNGSTIGSIWSALRIGNPLLGGDQIRGEIFRGTWKECRSVVENMEQQCPDEYLLPLNAVIHNNRVQEIH